MLLDAGIMNSADGNKMTQQSLTSLSSELNEDMDSKKR